MLRQLFLLKIKPDIEQERIDNFFHHMRSLKQKTPGVMSFSCGANRSQEGNEANFTHTMMMDFVDEEYYDFFYQQEDYQRIQQEMREIILDENGVTMINYPLA